MTTDTAQQPGPGDVAARAARAAQQEQQRAAAARRYGSRDLSGTQEQRLMGLYVPRSQDKKTLRPFHNEIVMSVEIVNETTCRVVFDRCYGDPSQHGLRRVTLVLNADPVDPYWTVENEKFYPMPTGPITSRRSSSELPAGHVAACEVASIRELWETREQQRVNRDFYRHRAAVAACYRAACTATQRGRAARAQEQRERSEWARGVLAALLAMGAPMT